jgi:uncharacterized iron-regulated membrane protein
VRKGRATVLRLHLAVALVAGAGLLLVSVSGAALVFRPELDDAVFGGPVRVAAGRPRAALQGLLDAGQAAHPGHPVSLLLPESDGRPARLRLERPGRETVEVLLHPTTARVLGSRWLERSPLHALHVLHTQLYLGARGRLAVATLGLLLVLQATTGVFLWWPFTRRLPRGFALRRARSWRVVGYDLHKVIGIASLAFNVPVAVTGTLLALSAHAGEAPVGAARADDGRSVLTLDEIVRRAEAIWPDAAAVSLRFQASAVEVREPGGGMVRVDRRSGAVTVVSDTGRLRDRLWALVTPAHEGRFGGLVSRWLYVAGGFTPVALALTGLGIWLGRPPRRERGS